MPTLKHACEINDVVLNWKKIKKLTVLLNWTPLDSELRILNWILYQVSSNEIKRI